MIRIYDTDDYAECARKIFYQFDVNQSCTIVGWVDEEIKPKGQLILDEIARLDKAENFKSQGKKMIRRRKVAPDSIGDYVAGKIFRFKSQIQGNEVKFVIWRMQ